MQVSRTTAYVDTTTVVASTTAARLSRVVVYPGIGSTNAAFVQLFNSLSLLGTTAPDYVIRIPASGASGEAARIEPVSVDFGGVLCDTVLNYGVATTATGATAPTGANAPGSVEVYFERLA